MNTASLFHHLFAVFLLASPAATGEGTPAPYPPAAGGGCADSVISFSPCLPYISAPPNDLNDEPSSQCCDIFNGAFDSDDAECLCYLVRQNSLLGFPLNVTKLLSLSDLCSVNNNSQANDTATNSLDSVCSGSPTLPPMIATPKKPPSDSNARHAPPPPRPPLFHPPPSTITNPSPANNASTQNATEPSTSDQSNDPDGAYFWLLLFGIIHFIIINQNIAGMGLNQT